RPTHPVRGTRDPVNHAPQALRAPVQNAKIDELVLREAPKLPPVTGRRVLPSEIPATEDLQRLGDLAREIVLDTPASHWIEKLGRNKIGHQHTVHGVGE